MLHHFEEFYVLSQFKIQTCKTATMCVFHRIYKSLLLSHPVWLVLTPLPENLAIGKLNIMELSNMSYSTSFIFQGKLWLL